MASDAADQPAEPPHNPYPGLRPFRTDEKHLFFGRERQVDRMVERLAAHHFLAVVGGSGSGKSSLVNCGLRPALHRGNMASAGATWRMAQLRPGSDPIGALARALAAPGVLFDAPPSSDSLSTEDLVETTLRMGRLGLVDIVEQADLAPGTQVLVVADQFEELFRFRRLVRGVRDDAYSAAEDAVAFVSLLLAAAAQTEVPIHVVLTMRSDFLGDCAQFDGLPEAINEGQYLVPRLTRNEIRAAITGPAAVAGRQISPVLVTRLLNDVGDNPDQLSILQHALNRTWAYWEHEGGAQGPLDLPHYLAIGGMAEALDRHAEKAHAELGSAERRRLGEQVFKVLTDKGTDARGTRRPTRFGDLCDITAATPQDLLSVIDVFRKPSRSFLMPPQAEPVTADSVIDISHESLMRVWKRLGKWADEEAQSARIYQRLALAAELHAQGKAALLPQIDLDQALHWRAKQRPNAPWARLYGGNFVQAMDYLDASHAQSAAAEAERGALRRVRAAAAGIALAVMLTFTALWVASVIQDNTSRWAAAHALLTDVNFAAKAYEARAKGGWPERDRDCAERFLRDDSDARHLPILAGLCDPQAAPPAGDVDAFLEVIALLSKGDLSQADRRLRELANYDTRRAAESMIQSVLDLQTQDLEGERRDLLALEELERDRARGADVEPAMTYEFQYRHPVHRSIDLKLRQGQELSAGERALLEFYKTRKLRLVPVGPAATATPEAAAASAPPPDSEEALYRPMMHAATRAESALAEVRSTLESYVTAFLVLLPWPVWKVWRWRQRRQARPIAARPSALRLALASFLDIVVAVGVGFLVGALTDSTLWILDLSVLPQEVTALTTLALGLLAGLAYVLLRDAIRLRYCRSLGKVAFDLRLVHAAGPAAPAQRGLISARTSARRNWKLFFSALFYGLAMIGLEITLEEELALGIPEHWRIALEAAVAFGLVMWLPALAGRRSGWHHRATGTEVIDADSEESRRVEAPARYVEAGAVPVAGGAASGA